MALLPFTTGAQMLGIHPKTLHHWLKEANVPFTLHPSDARIKCVDPQHLLEVAKLHDRSLPELPASREEQAKSLPAEPEQPSSSLPPIRASEPDLVQKLSCLETKVVSLQEQLAQLALALLQERERTIERRISALETVTAELVGKHPLPASQEQGGGQTLACASRRGYQLLPAEQPARSRVPALIEYSAQETYVIISSQEGELHLMPDSSRVV